MTSRRSGTPPRATATTLGFTAQVPTGWTERRDGRTRSASSARTAARSSRWRARPTDEVRRDSRRRASARRTCRSTRGSRWPAPTRRSWCSVTATDGAAAHRLACGSCRPRNGVLAVRLTAPGGSSETVSARLFDARELRPDAGAHRRGGFDRPARRRLRRMTDPAPSAGRPPPPSPQRHRCRRARRRRGAGLGLAPAADVIGAPDARARDGRPARLRPADGRGARRHGPLGARRRPAGAGAARPHPPLRGPRRRRRSRTGCARPRPRAAARSCSPTPRAASARAWRSATRC